MGIDIRRVVSDAEWGMLVDERLGRGDREAVAAELADEIRESCGARWAVERAASHRASTSLLHHR